MDSSLDQIDGGLSDPSSGDEDRYVPVMASMAAAAGAMLDLMADLLDFYGTPIAGHLSGVFKDNYTLSTGEYWADNGHLSEFGVHEDHMWTPAEIARDALSAGLEVVDLGDVELDSKTVRGIAETTRNRFRASESGDGAAQETAVKGAL